MEILKVTGHPRRGGGGGGSGTVGKNKWFKALSLKKMWAGEVTEKQKE